MLLNLKKKWIQHYFKIFLQFYYQSTLDGKLVDLYIANGRNNDPAMFQQSSLPNLLRHLNIKCLGDRAYSNGDLVVASLLNPRFPYHQFDKCRTISL